MKQTILIHHHIFKNAGTSFNQSLHKYFGERFVEFDLPNHSLVTKSILDEYISDRPDVLAISGHHICLQTPQSERYQTVSSVIIRHPLARILSIYSFEKKQNSETEGAIRAKSLSFKDYVLWRLEKTPTVYCNYQTHYCSRVRGHAPNYLATEEDLKVAIDNLQKCLIVGTVEKYQQTLKIAQLQLQKFYPDLSLEYKFLNVTRSSAKTQEDKIDNYREELRESLGEEIADRLEKMNYLDLKLYEIADSILEQQLSTLAVSI